jgi:hypothetical protein
MSVTGVRREKAALFQWVQGAPGNRSSRKRSEQSSPSSAGSDRERRVPTPDASGSTHKGGEAGRQAISRFAKSPGATARNAASTTRMPRITFSPAIANYRQWPFLARGEAPRRAPASCGMVFSDVMMGGRAGHWLDRRGREHPMTLQAPTHLLKEQSEIIRGHLIPFHNGNDGRVAQHLI